MKILTLLIVIIAVLNASGCADVSGEITPGATALHRDIQTSQGYDRETVQRTITITPAPSGRK